jgi:hypothetical protein
MLGVLLAAAAPPAAPGAYIDLPQLVAVNPLHAVLVEYDREIAALRSTQSVADAGNGAVQVQRARTALQREDAAAQRQVRAISSTAEGEERARERATLAVAAARQGENGSARLYAGQLVRETTATATAYDRAIAERSGRALAARQEQLREKELTLAFDLARADAGKRLLLRLKLADLHLTGAARAQLRATLAALDRHELDAVGALRREDAVTLQAYRGELLIEGERAQLQMDAQLRAKAGANYTMRQRVAQANSSAALPASVTTRAGAFVSGFHPQGEADAITSAMHDAAGDLGQRFAQLGAIDRRSNADTAVQIHELETDRGALYRAIVAEIEHTAQQLARQRHLGNLVGSGTRPDGSVDLTAAVRNRLARFEGPRYAAATR